MSYGLEIKNSAGNVIIEDSYKNFQVVAYGTTQAGSVIPYTNTFNDGGLVFGKPSGVNQNDSYGWHIAGNSTSATVFTGNGGTVTLSDPVQDRPNPFSGNTQQYDYTQTPITLPAVGKISPYVDWVYVKPSAISPSSSEYGLEVYAADGSVSYSSVLESNFELVASTTISNFSPAAYGQDDMHGTAYYGVPSGENAFDYYMCLTNLLSMPITSVPAFWGWVSSGKWTSSGITFFQPAFNIANFQTVGYQHIIGKFSGSEDESVDGGTPTQNSPPSYVSGVSSSYTLNSSGTTITPIFVDPEGGQITLLTSTSGTLGGANVSLINNGTQVRIVVGSSSANFTLTITASDGSRSTSRTTSINYNAVTNNPPVIAASSVASSYSLQGNLASVTITPLVTDSDGDSYSLTTSVSGSSTGMSITAGSSNVTVGWNGATTDRNFTLNITAVDSNGALSNTVSTVIYWEPSVSGPGPTYPNPNFPNNGIEV